METNSGKQDPTDCLKVVLYGPESTGKTTLAKMLADTYQTCFVPEFARDYLQKKWDASNEVCGLTDLLIITNEQIKLENQYAKKANKVLFCDTNVVVTEVWLETHFDGFCHTEIKKKATAFHYDYYLLTYIDVPWEQDDLRDRPNSRNEMFNAFQNKLETYECPYSILKGNEQERLEKAKAIVEALLTKKKARP